MPRHKRQPDPNEIYTNKDHYAKQDVEDNLYYHCDVEGIANGEDFEHVGDGYRTLAEAKFVCDFYANGGHWMNFAKAEKEWANGKT